MKKLYNDYFKFYILSGLVICFILCYHKLSAVVIFFKLKKFSAKIEAQNKNTRESFLALHLIPSEKFINLGYVLLERKG